MKIIIAGCGKIGTTVLKCFMDEGHDVVAVDKNETVISEITNLYDVMAVCGNGADCETLGEAGIEKAELFCAFTDSDELNMLSCFMAKRLGAKHTIARIRNPEYNDQRLGFMKQQLGLSMAVNPELLAAKELFNLLKLPSAVKVETFSRRNFEMIELVIRENSPLSGMKLHDLRNKFTANFLVGAVSRGEEVIIPDGSFVLKGGDRIGITASATEIEKLLREMGLLQKQAKNVMILGGSKTSFYLAKMLGAAGNPPKIIEIDEARCELLSELLPDSVIIHGNGAQQELLLEEGLDSLDAFVALTGMDEENILMSIFAASRKVPGVIAKVNLEELENLAENLGLECIISPKKIVADIVLRYARALENSIGSSKVETLYKLMDGKAEAVEFNVTEEFKYAYHPLKEINFKPNILIAGIIRGRKTIIPGGEDVIMPDDNVVVLTRDIYLSDLSDAIKN